MNYNIWTDGSSKEGCGGYAFLIEGVPSFTKSGYVDWEEKTTANRAELMAVQEAIKYLKDELKFSMDDEATIFCDSTYVINMLSKNWRARQNKDIIFNIRELMNGYLIKFQKTEAHSDDEFNKYVDNLAYEMSSLLYEKRTSSSISILTIIETKDGPILKEGDKVIGRDSAEYEDLTLEMIKELLFEYDIFNPT